MLYIFYLLLTFSRYSRVHVNVPATGCGHISRSKLVFFQYSISKCYDSFVHAKLRRRATRFYAFLYIQLFYNFCILLTLYKIVIADFTLSSEALQNGFKKASNFEAESQYKKDKNQNFVDESFRFQPITRHLEELFSGTV